VTWRLQGERDIAAVPGYTRLGLVAASLLAVLIALAIPSVVKQWYAFGNVFVPGMLIPLLGAYAPSPRWKAPARYAFWSMLLGASLALACLLWGWAHGGYDDPHYPLGW